VIGDSESTHYLARKTVPEARSHEHHADCRLRDHESVSVMPAADLVDSGFFVLRTPLLPLATLDGWWRDEMDTSETRRRLEDLIQRPEVLEALHLASPDLLARSQTTKHDKEHDPKRDRIERAVGAYVVRMASRPTPFGLFAGCGTGTITENTSLSVPALDAVLRRSWLDTGVLTALAVRNERDPDARAALRYQPNDSIYAIGGRLRYIETRMTARTRTHHLVAVDLDEALRATLGRARDGARPDDLAEALPGDDITLDEAHEYISALIETGLLVSDLHPAVTGDGPVGEMISVLRRSAATDKTATRLEHAQSVLERLDADGLGSDLASYTDLEVTLREEVRDLDAGRLVQVDMIKPALGLTLGRPVVAELAGAVRLLHRITPSEETSLDRFRVAFEQRYGTREVALTEALDEELGVGFERSEHPAADESPLLAGLNLRPLAQSERRWRSRDAALLKLLSQALEEQRQEIVLREADLNALAEPAPRPLPDALAVMATLAGTTEGIARGEFRVLIHGVNGPSGAALLGRFCAGNPQLAAAVRRHLHAEEAHRPDVVYAEVVHLPEGRTGNILRRPVLRTTEIAFLGRSGAPTSRQLSVDDLLLSVQAGQLVLRSRRLGRQVLPRLSTAHYTALSSVGIYRFLSALQYQGVAGGLRFDWGPLNDAPFLPRVTCGRLVLARARWRLAAEELTGLRTVADVRRLRHRRRLPRFVAVADGDNELLVDFDRDVSVKIGLRALAGRKVAELIEVYPLPDELCANGPEGLFTHELIVPFTTPITVPPSSRSSPRVVPRSAAGLAAAADSRRRFPPGSQWCYLKVYAGTAGIDDLLREVIAPAVARIRVLGAAKGWFFVRYADPDSHLRLRLAGDPERLRTEVQPLLIETLGSFLADGRAWRIQLDTYEREVERYGGPEGMQLAEEAFCVDSDAVLGILALTTGERGLDARWRLCLAGLNSLLDDFGLDVATKQHFAQQQRDGYRTEWATDPKLNQQLGQDFRTERAALEELLHLPGPGHRLGPGLAPFGHRSVRMRLIAQRLRELEVAGRLTVPVEDWIASIAHMAANRLLRSAQRAHELVLWDWLARLYHADLARTGKRP
jgi:thiopeptide-type bacteriocin biosynthesis protein